MKHRCRGGQQPKVGDGAISEAALLDQIIGQRGLAPLLGWKSLHIRPARVLDDKAKDGYSWRTPVQGDGTNFPDLLLVRPPRFLVAELKMDGKEPRPGQREWLDLFVACELEAYLWTGSDFEEIREILATGHVPSMLEMLTWKSSWINRREK